jgi:hypothetical protein
MAVGPTDVKGPLGNQIIARDVLVHDLDSQQVILGGEGEDISPVGLLATGDVLSSSLGLAADGDDDVGVLGEGKTVPSW